MVPTLKFLEALSMLPSVARIRRRAKRAWGGSVPIQLDFALVGAQIADHILLFSDDQRSYIRGVLEYGLKEGPHHLRMLVLRPLLSTLFERARRMGNEHETAIFQHLYVLSHTENRRPT